MKRKTVLMDQETINQVKSLFNLNSSEMNDLVNYSKKYDPKQTGSVSKTEVDDMMRDLEVLPKNRQDNQVMYEYFNGQMNDYQNSYMDFKQICDLYCKLKRFLDQLKEEETITQEYLDAFVALGGEHDKSGSVQKQTIIDIVQNEFELNLDIESFLGDFAREFLNFEEFCQLFENAGDDAKSIITSRSRKDIKDPKDLDFNVKFRDFERWEKISQ